MVGRFLEGLWSAAATAKAKLYAAGIFPIHRLDRPTISVGALHAGGTGKTPATATVARLLQAAGQQPAILSRGYRRRGRHPSLVCRGRGLILPIREAGDEPAWFARVLPTAMVAVAGQRERAASLVGAAGGCDVYLLDDGYQHLRVARQINLLVVDGDAPFWEGRLLPTGRLREGPAAASRADGFLLLGHQQPGSARCWLHRQFADRPIFELLVEDRGFWRLEQYAATPENEPIGPPEPRNPVELDSPLLAFAGIARPDRFWLDLREHGMRVMASRSFPDHFWYRRSTLQRLEKEAVAAGADALITTEKDAMRLTTWTTERLPIYVWKHRLRAADTIALQSWLLDRLSRAATLLQTAKP